MLCASWLNDCESLPDNLKTHLANNDLKFADFAECLKDGLVLCNLLDYLNPGCVDFTKLHVQYAYLPRALCIDNIKIFLDACKNAFEMAESDLFEPEMVYDLDVAPVIRSLSSLSRCKAAQARCNGGFVYDEDNDASPTTGDSIYEEIYKKKVVCGNYIQMAPFILSMNTDEISQYAEILKLSSQTKASGLFEATVNLNPPKHVHIIKEIIVTEETFIKMIKSLIDHYLKPLAPIVTENDRKIISLNFETILNVHCKFYDGLYDACLVPENRTLKICEVFIRFKKQFMADYGEYFSKINETNIKLNQLNKSKVFKRKLEECRANSSFSYFSITDLVILPFQRISRYHLLLKELYKSKSRSSDPEEAKSLIKSTWEAAEDVCAYLNEMQKVSFFYFIF
jgi:guanine nucleotide exchange factor VAV